MPTSYELPEFRKYKKKLEKLGDDVLPRVIAETINQVAGFAHVQQARNIRSRFVNRNTYTERSLRYYKANPKKNYAKINAVTGSISDYMDEQDSGGYRYPKQGKKAPVATMAARGGNSRSRVKKANYAGTLGPNRFIGKPRGYGKKGPRPYGVYSRNLNNKYLVMIRNISSAKVKIKETRWHREAVDKYATRAIMTEAFVRNAQREIDALSVKNS